MLSAQSWGENRLYYCVQYVTQYFYWNERRKTTRVEWSKKRKVYATKIFMLSEFKKILW